MRKMRKKNFLVQPPSPMSPHPSLPKSVRLTRTFRGTTSCGAHLREVVVSARFVVCSKKMVDNRIRDIYSQLYTHLHLGQWYPSVPPRAKEVGHCTFLIPLCPCHCSNLASYRKTVAKYLTRCALSAQRGAHMFSSNGKGTVVPWESIDYLWLASACCETRF